MGGLSEEQIAKSDRRAGPEPNLTAVEVLHHGDLQAPFQEYLRRDDPLDARTHICDVPAARGHREVPLACALRHGTVPLQVQLNGTSIDRFDPGRKAIPDGDVVQ